MNMNNISNFRRHKPVAATVVCEPQTALELVTAAV